MAQMEDSTKKKKPRKATCFLGCFGIYNQEKNLSSDYYVKSASSKKKKKSLFSFSKFVGKHSAKVKTIPGDISENFNRSREIHVVNSDKISVKTPETTVDVTQVQVKNQTNSHEKVNKTKNAKTQDKIHRNNQSLDHLFDNVQDSTRQNEFSRSVTIASTHKVNNIVSPKDKDDIKLSHSKSLPPPKLKKSPAATTTSKVNDEKSNQRHDQAINNNFDSIIGMSVLLVTLLIMLFWGKVCAIICTSAWFYFLPRFRMKNEAIISGKKRGISGDVDVNSDEYKKKVVFEGFLERNHKNGVGLL